MAFQMPPLPSQMPARPMGMPGQQVGMVPGVPGSMGLNPGAGGPVMQPGGGTTGAPLQAPQPPSGVFPINPGAGPVMTPGGGGTGAPPQFGGQFGGRMGVANAMMPQFNNFRTAMDTFRDNRPDRSAYSDPQAFQSAMQSYRQTRPNIQSFFAPPTPGAMSG